MARPCSLQAFLALSLRFPSLCPNKGTAGWACFGMFTKHGSLPGSDISNLVPERPLPFSLVEDTGFSRVEKLPVQQDRVDGERLARCPLPPSRGANLARNNKIICGKACGGGGQGLGGRGSTRGERRATAARGGGLEGLESGLTPTEGPRGEGAMHLWQVARQKVTPVKRGAGKQRGIFVIFLSCVQ